MRKRKFLTRVLAIALMISMLIPDVAYAAGQTSSGNMGAGGVVSSAYTRLMGDPGAVIGLQLVSNNLSKTEKSTVETKGKNDAAFDAVGVATSKQYLYKFPDFFTVGEISSWTALIPIYTGAFVSNYKNYFVDGTSKRSTAWSSNRIYPVKGGNSANTSWKPNLISSKLTAKQLEDLGNGKLAWSVVKSYRDSNKAALETAKDKFLATFSRTANVSTFLNGLLDYNATTDEEKRKNAAIYLDVLLLVNYMAGNSTDAVIKSYLKTANKNDAEEFAVVFIASAVSWEDQANSFRDWYTLPTYYAAATGKGVNKYQSILPSGVDKIGATEWTPSIKATKGNYKTNRAAYMSSLYSKYNAVGTAKADGNSQRMLSTNQSAIWWSSAQGSIGGMSNWETALAFNPTNIYGIPSGNTGYTYYSSMGAKIVPTESFEIDGNIKIVVDPKTKKVSPGDKTKVSISVDLTSDKKQIDDAEKAFKYAEEKGYKVNVTFELKWDVESKSKKAVVNDHYFDKYTNPKIWATDVPDGTKNKQTLVLEDVKWKGQFANYMTGKYQMKFQDLEIEVNDNATIKYKVGVKVEMVDGTKGNVIKDDRLWFWAQGKGTAVENTDGGTEKAYSVASTKFQVDPPDEGKLTVKYNVKGKIDEKKTKEETFKKTTKVKASNYKVDIPGCYYVKADPTSLTIKPGDDEEMILYYDAEDPSKGKVEVSYRFNGKIDTTKTRTEQYPDGEKVKAEEFKETFPGYSFIKATPEEVTVKKGETKKIILDYKSGGTGGNPDDPEGTVVIKYRFDEKIDESKTVTETFPGGTTVTGDDYEEDFEGYEYEGSTPEEVTVDPDSSKEIILDYKSLGKVVIKYRFDGEIDETKTVEEYFPEGEVVKGDDYEEEFEEFEYVGPTPEEVIADPNEPKEIILDYRTPPALPYGEEEHYYSEAEEAYVEIKEGTPGHETFEAMAGVPTTENLYLGFGATEFMMNMDVKHEISENNPTRDYKLTYTATNCAGVDTKCVYSCPGHQVTFGSHNTCAGPHDGEGHSCSNCGGGSTTVYCDKPGTYTSRGPQVSCPGHVVVVTNSGKSYSISVTGGSCAKSSGTLYGAGHTECIGKDGSSDFTGKGCVHTKHTNTTHTHTHTFEGTIHQPIDPFTYIDIKSLELWQVNALKLESQEGLFKTPNVEFSPNTGYYAFYSQEGYQDNNGRLYFDFRWKDGERFGNTTTSITDPEVKLFTDCDKAATKWMNDTVKDVKVQATVVSDYLVLETTEGYQVPSYHQYTSDRVKITTTQFQADGNKNCQDDGSTGNKLTAKEITGDNVTFSNVPNWEKKWTFNPMSTKQWDEEGYGIVRSGYNGNYASFNTKWNNTAKIMVPVNPIGWLGTQPNTQNKEGLKDFRADGFGNTRMTYLGLDIVDSTTTDSAKSWSPDDGIEPVSNGVWDTGVATLRADKEITFNPSGKGVNYGSPDAGTEAGDGTTYLKTVGYTAGQVDVNDIVVYDPVSTQYAIVVCNDKKYDKRTQESLAEGGDPEVEGTPEGCPRDDSCQYSILTCQDHGSIHSESCFMEVQTGVEHKGGLNAHEHIEGVCGIRLTADGITRTSSYAAAGTAIYQFTATADGTVNFWSTSYTADPRGCIYVNGSCVVDDDDGGDGYNFRASTYVSKGSTVMLLIKQYGTVGGGTCTWNVSGTPLEGTFYSETSACKGDLNKHVCTDQCAKVMSKELICDDPHHHLASELWDYNLAINHHDFGDSRCWSPCGEDTKHIPQPEVSLGSGQVASTNDTFINLDREFRIYFPDLGDFAQAPTLHGIASVSTLRGMGYTDKMDTYKWVRNKFVTLPVNVLWYSSTGESKSFYAGQRIDLDKLEYDSGGYGWYTFYAVLGNTEAINAAVQFDAIGVNAEEIDWYRENPENRNLNRTSADCAAKHTAYKVQLIDVVGNIGSLAINDTGDFRFSNLFKTTLDTTTNGWLIENLVPKVDYKKPYKVVTDSIDVRNEVASAATKFHDTYGTLYNQYGGKAYETLPLPLTPAYNNIKALQNQPMRPGYQLYMDVETTGNYYGENRNAGGYLQDNNLYYKMQITPRYWELNLDTGEYQPVDVYFGLNGNYQSVAKFHSSEATDWYYYVDWLEESARRNYTNNEKEATAEVIRQFSDPEFDKIRQPQGKDVIGTASRLFLNDMNRTFIGSTQTYSVERNPQDAFANDYYSMQAQRWHFTLGLPSSSVFVYANQPCTTDNIEAIQNHNSVILCSLDIKVKGDVWTLEYDGKGINNVGIQIEEGGRIYPPPIDPEDDKSIDDPIVTIYTNKFTARDDLNTEGSH